jgi:cytochrome c oxidase accessory protein FixG
MVTVIDRTAPPPPASPISAAARLRASKAGGGLYKKRTPIYPKLVHGRWRNVKWLMLIATLAIYYITPWIRWDRPGNLPDQAVLVDFDHGRFYFFFIELWPQEFFFFTGLLVMSALALFLTTALFGRLWCGYSCPQTVWTDLFIYIERAFEGDRNARMRLDAAPMSFNKFWRKTGKHLVWIGVAFGTGGAWIFYWRDAPTLLWEFWHGQAPITSYVSCALLTLTTYIFAGTMREQVCTYMCPWPRIQGAMLDQHSLQVTYLRDRGEPRGPHRKADAWEGRGDCIDCGQCVVVCPMGIDIRDGSQLECINCGLCVDACDEIMRKVDRPEGLIGYDTDAAVAARECGQKPRYKPVRGRTIFYAAALTVLSGLMVWGLLHRTTLDLHVVHDRSPLFVRMQNGAVRNGYTLQFGNRTVDPRRLTISVRGLAQPSLKTPGAPPSSSATAVVPSDQGRSLRLFITAKPPTTAETVPVVIEARAENGEVLRVASTFFTGGDR